MPTNAMPTIATHSNCRDLGNREREKNKSQTEAVIFFVQQLGVWRSSRPRWRAN